MITLAIVPILVQAGTSILPALFAGAGTFCLILLRPLRLLRGPFWKSSIAVCATAAILITIGSIWGGVRGSGRARAATDWAQVAMNMIRSEELANRQGTVGDDGPIHLQPAWEFKLPGASFLSTPVFKDGRLYGASCAVDVGSTFGSVFCLDAMTGQPIWHVEKIGNKDLKGIFSSAAITTDGRYIVIGEGLHFDQECHLICLDARTGALHWQVEVPYNHVESSPAISGDVVVVGAGAIERADHLPVNSPGYVFGVRISDGTLLWRRDIVDPESSPAISSDGVTYIGSGVNGRAILAISATGEEVWRTPTLYPATGPISLVNNLVVTGIGRGDLVNSDPHPAGAVLAANRDSGQIQWQQELSDAVLGQIAIGDDLAFCPVRDGTVIALRLEDGTKFWSKKITQAPVLAGPTLAGGYLYITSSDGFLFVLEAKTGCLIEKHALNAENNPGHQNICVSSPVVSGDRIFIGTETGGLRCFSGTSH